MLHTVDQLLCSEYIDVEVMRTAVEITVHDTDQSILPLLERMAKCLRADGLRVGYSIQRVFIRHLCDRVEGCQKAFLFCTVGGISAGCERLVRLSAVRSSAGRLAIDDIGCDRKDRCRRLGIAVCVISANTVVISPDRFHDVIILILDRAGVDGYLHRAVLCLDRGKIAEIQPLYRFLDI